MLLNTQFRVDLGKLQVQDAVGFTIWAISSWRLLYQVLKGIPLNSERCCKTSLNVSLELLHNLVQLVVIFYQQSVVIQYTTNYKGLTVLYVSPVLFVRREIRFANKAQENGPKVQAEQCYKRDKGDKNKTVRIQGSPLFITHYRFFLLLLKQCGSF